MKELERGVDPGKALQWGEHRSVHRARKIILLTVTAQIPGDNREKLHRGSDLFAGCGIVDLHRTILDRRRCHLPACFIPLNGASSGA